jgi:hypothetical protein
MNEYIDVRGTWPVYFNGFIAVELIGLRRGITLEGARTFARIFCRQLRLELILVMSRN